MNEKQEECNYKIKEEHEKKQISISKAIAGSGTEWSQLRSTIALDNLTFIFGRQR